MILFYENNRAGKEDARGSRGDKVFEAVEALSDCCRSPVEGSDVNARNGSDRPHRGCLYHPGAEGSGAPRTVNWLRLW